MNISYIEKYDRINRLKLKKEFVEIGNHELLGIILPEQTKTITLYLNMSTGKIIIESLNYEGTYSYTSRQFTKSYVDGLLYKVAQNYMLNLENGTIYNKLAKSL